MDVDKLLQMASQLQAKMNTAQGEARALRHTGESGGGMVQVVMNGQHEVVSVHIDGSVLGEQVKVDDLRLLEDLLMAAVNQAASAARIGVKGRMGALAKDFGVDLSALDGTTPDK